MIVITMLSAALAGWRCTRAPWCTFIHAHHARCVDPNPPRAVVSGALWQSGNMGISISKRQFQWAKVVALDGTFQRCSRIIAIARPAQAPGDSDILTCDHGNFLGALKKRPVIRSPTNARARFCFLNSHFQRGEGNPSRRSFPSRRS